MAAKISHPAAALLVCACTGALVAGPPVRPQPGAPERGARRVPAAQAELPLAFEENRGRRPGGARFLARGSRYSVAVTSSGPVLRLASARPGQPPVAEIRVELVGARKAASLEGEARLPGTVSYFHGSDSRRWVRGAPTYRRVRARNAYPGIDVVYYGSREGLEYDFELEPGADPGGLRVAYGGAERAMVDSSGALILAAAGGKLRQPRPFAYQEIGGRRAPVECDYLLPGPEPAVGFRLGAYDRSRKLVIDPFLQYSSFLGGSQIDAALDVAVNQSGEAIACGLTFSGDFPQVSPVDNKSALYTAFVTRFSADGSAVLSSTYLGGAGGDIATAIGLDGSGNIYVAGTTMGTGFPVVSGFQSMNANPTAGDAFLAKLNPSGTQILYSTYYGGYETERGVSMAVSAGGQATLLGSTASLDLRLRSPIQATLKGASDAFVAQFDTTQAGDASLKFATFYGGGGGEAPFGADPDDLAGAICTDSTGTLYFSFGTASGDLATTPGAFQRIYGGGSSDGFSVKLNASATSVLFATYVGGNGADVPRGLITDADGNIFGAGYTSSTNALTSSGAFQRQYGGGSSDGIFFALSPGGTTGVYSSYFGGSGEDRIFDLARGTDGQLYFTGSTTSPNFPLVDALGAAGPDEQAFIARLNPAAAGAAALLYSTQIPGAAGSRGTGIGVDGTGSAFVAGWTVSAGFAVTPGAYQRVLAGSTDAFLLKLDPRAPPPAAPTGLTAAAVTPLRVGLAWTNNAVSYTHVEIERKLGSGSFTRIAEIPRGIADYNDDAALPGNTYTYRVRALNDAGPSAWSNEASATTPRLPPLAPKNLRATVVSTSGIDLAWEAGDATQTEFVLQRRRSTGQFQDVATVPGDKTAYDDRGLSSTTEYTYRVRARNEAGDSPYSEEVSATTQGPPVAPSNLEVASNTAELFELTWQDNSFNESGFSMDSRVEGGFYQFLALYPPNTQRAAVANLQPNTTYFFRVKAYNGFGVSAFSNEASATTPGPPAAAPKNLTLRFASGRVELHWDNPTGPPATHFLVERRQGTGEYAQVGTAPISDTTIRYTDSGPFANAEYRYRVRSATNTAISQPCPENMISFPLEGQMLHLPASVNFGKAGTGSQVRRMLRLRNLGTRMLQVEARDPATPFAITSDGNTFIVPNTSYTVLVAPGRSRSFILWFTGTGTTGDSTRTLTLTTTDPRKTTVDVTLKGRSVASW